MSISGVATLMENYILRKIGAIEKANDTEEEEGTRSKNDSSHDHYHVLFNLTQIDKLIFTNQTQLTFVQKYSRSLFYFFIIFYQLTSHAQEMTSDTKNDL